MKKFVLGIIVAVVAMMLFGCGGGSDDAAPAPDESGTVETQEMQNEESEPSDAAEEASDAEASDTAEESSDSDSGAISPEFKKTMDDYEAWFDHYCEVMKKYQENPSDLELMSEMSELLAEESTMLEQMENMNEDDMNAAELAYYLEVTARIEKNLLEVADY